MAKSKKDDKYKHSPARLYEFVPDENITPNNVVELANRSSANGPAMSGGSKSRRVDSICPNLTNTGPSVCNASRRRSPRERFILTDGIHHASAFNVPRFGWGRSSSIRSENKTRRILKRRNELPMLCLESFHSRVESIDLSNKRGDPCFSVTEGLSGHESGLF